MRRSGLTNYSFSYPYDLFGCHRLVTSAWLRNRFQTDLAFRSVATEKYLSQRQIHPRAVRSHVNSDEDIPGRLHFGILQIFRAQLFLQSATVERL